jgi:Na+-driven multidrug efflux pump
MAQTTIGNPLGSASITKLMLKFSIPSIISMLVGALYNIVDQLFIGQTVGMLGNAATNVAFPLSTSCIALSLLFGIGGAACFNLKMGAGEKEEASYAFGNAFIMLIVSGVLLAAISMIFLNPLLRLFGAPDSVMPYAQEYIRITAIGFPFLILTAGGGHLIRADGSPAMTMICNLVGAVVNTILDAIFVLKLNMGMSGAAYATIIGQILSALLVIIYLCRYRKVQLQKKHLLPQFAWIRKITAIGMASFFNQVAIMVVQIILNNMLQHYGAASVYGDAIPLACAGIIMKVYQIIFSVVIGLGQGIQPIVSFNYGAKKYPRVWTAYRIAVTVGAGISILAFIFFELFPQQIISLFGDGSEQYYQFGVRFFRIFLFFTWLNCLQPITTTFFTAIGKAIKGAFLSLTRQIIFFLPLLLILPLFFGIDGILYTGPIADLLSAIVTILMVTAEWRSMKKLTPAQEG